MADGTPAASASSNRLLRSSRATVGALVIGGNYRGLGIVRSLGRRGIPVWVLLDEHLIAGISRYARRRLWWPRSSESRQVEFLLDLGARHRLDGWVLFPTGDETAALISRHHAPLSEIYRLAVPPWETMEWAYDKRLTYRLAGQVGVDCPWTYHPGGDEELHSLECPFPAILKPAIKEGFNPFIHAKAWRVDDRDSLVARYREACGLVSPDLIMVQEFIPGGGEEQFSYAALCREGDPIASIVARRTRQYPMDFGRSSSYVETIDLPEVEEPSLRLLEATRYTGLVEVEFKRDPRDGRYRLLDVNPRVWGWHTLGRRAGVDFPHLQWRLMHGLPVPDARARPGVRWVRMTTDLPVVAREIWRGRLSLADYLRSLRGPIELAIFAPDDPLPALAEVPLLSYVPWRRGAA